LSPIPFEAGSRHRRDDSITSRVSAASKIPPIFFTGEHTGGRSTGVEGPSR
jgi:hypothetical protein